MEYQKATIEEESDTKEWMDSSDEPSVNRLFSDNLDDFNNITIWYIGTDASLMELHMELSINATLKPLDAFVFKYRTQDISTAEEKVPAKYHKYLDIFKEEVEQFPDSRPWDHAIKTKPRFEPRVFKSYNLTLEEHEQQELFIKENLKKRYIRLSRSPMASPFFFVNKKDGKLWPTQDYWYLNQWTIKNTYQLLLISEIIDKIKASGAKYFTKFDIQWGFNNICIKDSDQWKAAFMTNLGLYKPTVMFFGLCNSPLMFQAMMNDTLKDEIEEGFCIIHMNDILIFAKNLNDSPNAFLKASNKLTFTSNHWNASFAKWSSNTLALLLKKARWWWTPPNLTEFVTGWSPGTLNKYALSLDLENFIDVSFRNSLSLLNPWTNSSRKTNHLFGTLPCNKPLTKWRNTLLKNQSSWCWIKPGPSKLNVMHRNMHPVQSLCNSRSTVIDIYICAFISWTFSLMEWNYEIYDHKLLSVICALQEWWH